jgi:DNA replication protein DnaC
MTSHSRLLRVREVAEWIGVSQSAIYKWSARVASRPPSNSVATTEARSRAGSKKTFNSGYRSERMHPIPNSRLILGPPGCGKTHTLIEIVREALAKGVHPSRIAFVSFTTKAVREALDRACAEFNLEPKQLPHFRTLHATGYHALGLQRTDVHGPCGLQESGRAARG